MQHRRANRNSQPPPAPGHLGHRKQPVELPGEGYGVSLESLWRLNLQVGASSSTLQKPRLNAALHSTLTTEKPTLSSFVRLPTVRLACLRTAPDHMSCRGPPFAHLTTLYSHLRSLWLWHAASNSTPLSSFLPPFGGV